jgi:hypothetical protein
MISLTHTRYGSCDFRQGKSRACIEYQASKRQRSDRFSADEKCDAVLLLLDLRSVAVAIPSILSQSRKGAKALNIAEPFRLGGMNHEYAR